MADSLVGTSVADLAVISAVSYPPVAPPPSPPSPPPPPPTDDTDEDGGGGGGGQLAAIAGGAAGGGVGLVLLGIGAILYYRRRDASGDHGKGPGAAKEDLPTAAADDSVTLKHSPSASAGLSLGMRV